MLFLLAAKTIKGQASSLLSPSGMWPGKTDISDIYVNKSKLFSPFQQADQTEI